MRGQTVGLLALGAALAAAGPANAGIDEVHVGVMDHNICVTNCKNADKEGSPNVEFQVSFDSPEMLHWAFSPQPYVMASVSTTGDTSFGGFGLEWRWQFADHWAVEPGVGYVLHDGENNNKYPNGTPESQAFSDEHVLLGSRDLFRTSLGLTYDMDGPWEVQALFEHLSHGQILGNGRNQGLDELGIRVGYRFGD
jgi:lipid A 3-O-deacylase